MRCAGHSGLAAWHVGWCAGRVGWCSLADSTAVRARTVYVCMREGWQHDVVWCAVLCRTEMHVAACAACAGVVFNMGLLSEATQADISQRSEDVIQSVSQGEWETVGSMRHTLWPCKLGACFGDCWDWYMCEHVDCIPVQPAATIRGVSACVIQRCAPAAGGHVCLQAQPSLHWPHYTTVVCRKCTSHLPVLLDMPCVCVSPRRLHSYRQETHARGTGNG